MKEMLIGLAMGATVTAIAPILLPLPKPLATGSLLLSMGLGGTLTALAKSYERIEKIETAQYDTAVLQPLRVQMAQQRTQQTLAANAAAKMDALTWADQCLPPELQAIALAEFGLQPLYVQRQQQAFTTTARELPQSAPVEVAHHPSGYSDLRDRLSSAAPTAVFDDRAYRQLPTQQPHPETLDVLDVAEIMADYDGHVLLACRTGSGKTSTLQAAIAKKHQRYGGMVDFHIIDPKGAYWLGLEKDGDYSFVPEADDLTLAVERVEIVCSALSTRMRQRMQQGGHWETPPMPLVLIIDELNTLLSRLQAWDKEEAKVFMSGLIQIICQGREDNVHLWAVAQTSQIENLQAGGIKLNTSMQQNMICIALARLGDYQSVDGAVINRVLVPAGADRDRLSLELADYKAKQPNPEQGIAFVSRQGGMLGRVPDYSPYKRMQLDRKAQNQSSEEVTGDVWADPPKPQHSEERLMELLLEAIDNANAWDQPKEAIAQIIKGFWKSQGRPVQDKTAIEMANYLRNLKQSGEL